MARNLCPGLLGTLAALVLVTTLFAPTLRAQSVTPADLRSLLTNRVGDIGLLRVPDSDVYLPQPRLPGGAIDPRYAITEEKRYLGKLLFQDPVRTTDIQPAFGGDVGTLQTASCGSCHFAEAASKAGQLINFGIGGEGRMTMDLQGTFQLVRQQNPLLTDSIPTTVVLTDAQDNIILHGNFDAVDSAPRLAPAVLGFAYNQRLFWDGAAGEPFDAGNPGKANINPDDLPAGENNAQATSMAHRMGTQETALQQNTVYRQLFADAFPQEYALYLQSGDVAGYINKDTVIRALAAFMRTVITRNTPWDAFLAGDDAALTSSELQGAWLFAAPLASGGADCISCHSGPALNKQLGDELGLLVEENFYNLGLNDHPLQEMVRTVFGDPNHHDGGRAGVTADPADAFKFRTPTLRQVRDGRQYMHSGELSSVRSVVEYFDVGVPASTFSVTPGNVAPRFTNPHGPGSTGLGLSQADIDALVDFQENALYDRAFVEYDPSSSTRTFDPNLADLTYSAELKALGAVDGLLPSGKTVGNDDLVSRHQTLFVRGHVNRDDKIDLADAIFLIAHLFRGAPAPDPVVAADTNGDGRVDISDPIYLLNFIFQGTEAPPMPFPLLGQFVR
jgi:cytochrome c peroxidase